MDETRQDGEDRTEQSARNTGDESERENASLEELFNELEDILTAMDDRDISLEDSFALYEKGMKTVRLCYDRLDRVEKKMRVIAQDGSEVPVEE